ncbi:hypothetical protein KGY79_01770 [Candidatus Bipolaricaulota bacterium]|nr:hypothetical protein [Candidatus Bipolaricaulota bacterium]
MSIKENLRQKSNEELQKIYRENDRDKWRKEAIEMAGELLKERGKELPEQEPSTKGSKGESSTAKSKALNEEDFTEGGGSIPTLILGVFGVLSVIIGIMLLWNLYSGESTAGWFREISSILLINLGFIGWGFATLISMLKKVMNQQNKLLVKLINKRG